MQSKLLKISKSIIWAIVLMLCFFSANVKSFAEGESNEYNIKAMFILNFMKYVEWPAESENGVFKIGIAGDSELYDALQSMIKKRNENINIKVERVKADTKESFQIIIISHSENKRIEEWVKKYQGKGVLVISDGCKNADFSAINLVNVKNKIRFEINNSQAKLGGIKISSKLSEMATTVYP